MATLIDKFEHDFEHSQHIKRAGWGIEMAVLVLASVVLLMLTLYLAQAW